jgi:hypothetical protein
MGNAMSRATPSQRVLAVHTVVYLALYRVLNLAVPAAIRRHKLGRYIPEPMLHELVRCMPRADLYAPDLYAY